MDSGGRIQFSSVQTVGRAQGKPKPLSFLVSHRGNTGRRWTAVASGGRGNDRNEVPSSASPLNSLSPRVPAGRSQRGTAMSASSVPGAVNEAAAGVCAEVLPGVFG